MSASVPPQIRSSPVERRDPIGDRLGTSIVSAASMILVGYSMCDQPASEIMLNEGLTLHVGLLSLCDEDYFGNGNEPFQVYGFTPARSEKTAKNSDEAVVAMTRDHLKDVCARLKRERSDVRLELNGEPVLTTVFLAPHVVGDETALRLELRATLVQDNPPMLDVDVLRVEKIERSRLPRMIVPVNGTISDNF